MLGVCLAAPGDRVEVLHNGIPTGRFGTVLVSRAGCLEVRGDGDGDDRFPMWDSEDCFRVVSDVQIGASLSNAGLGTKGLI